MRVCDCVGTVNDLHGNIIGYQLRALDGEVVCLDTNKLKNALRQRIIAVANLTYTKNNRIIIKSKSLFDKRNLLVYNNLTFEMWLNNILETVKLKYGGIKGVVQSEVGSSGSYDYIYSQVSDIPLAGGGKINICINLGKVVIGDRNNNLVLTVEDVISGVTISETEVKLKSPLWCQENTKIVENAVDRIIIKNLGHIVKEYINSKWNGGK